MQDPTADQVTVGEVMARLQLWPADGQTAYGEIDGSPVTLTILGMEPLALLWAFKLHGGASALPALAPELQEALPEFQGTLTLEDGYGWLSLYGLSQAGSDGIEAIVRLVARDLREGGVVLGQRCASCGDTTNAELVHIEGRTSRLCPDCVENLYAAKQVAERELNRGSLIHGATLPIIFTLTAIGWMVFWVTVDLVFEWLAIRVLVIDQFVGMFLIGLLGAVGFGLGTFLGTSLRQSGATRLSPTAVAGSGVILATIAGEVLYVAFCVFRQIGVFDLAVAWAALVPFIQGYPKFWIAGKLIVIALATFGAMQAAAPERAAVRL